MPSAVVLASWYEGAKELEGSAWIVGWGVGVVDGGADVGDALCDDEAEALVTEIKLERLRPSDAASVIINEVREPSEAAAETVADTLADIVVASSLYVDESTVAVVVTDIEPVVSRSSRRRVTSEQVWSPKSSSLAP